MTARELAILVKKCRGKQQAFFLARRKGYAAETMLSECRELEKLVDRAVAEVLGDTGPGLFEEEPT